MDGLGQIAAVLGGLVVGVLIGLWAGGKVRGKPVVFWVVVAIGFLAGTIIAFLGQITAQAWVMFLGLGLLGGLLTGLRYGYGQPLGPFKALDRYTHAENLPEKRAEAGAEDVRDR